MKTTLEGDHGFKRFPRDSYLTVREGRKNFKERIEDLTVCVGEGGREGGGERLRMEREGGEREGGRGGGRKGEREGRDGGRGERG